MGQAWDAQLVGDLEDPLVVGAARRTARCAHELDVAGEASQAAQRGVDPVAIEIEDLGGDRRTAARFLEEGGGLPLADPGDVLPALLLAGLAGRPDRQPPR